jgi:PAS domain S-box-containing protein
MRKKNLHPKPGSASVRLSSDTGDVLSSVKEQYRLLSDGLFEGFALLEIIGCGTDCPPDFRIISVNPVFEHLTGVNPSRVVGKTCRELWPDIAPRSLEYLAEAALSGKSVKFEHYVKENDRFYEIFAYSASPRQCAAIFRDVTECKRAHKAMEEDMARRKVLFDHSPDGIVIIDPETAGFVDFNTAAHTQLGYTREEFKSLTIHDMEAEETRAETRARIAGVIRSGKADFDTLQRTRSGEVRNVHVTAQNIDILGKPVYFCIWRDITDRKSIEERLIKSEFQLANALKMARLGPWEYDVATDTFQFNDLFYALFRTTAKDVGGYEMSSEEYAARFIPPEFAPLVRKEIEMTLATLDRNFSRQFEHPMKYADGSTGYLSVRYFAIRDQKGRVIKTCGVNQDITEHKLSEERLKIMIHEKEILLREVNHRVKNNLQIISSLSHLQEKRIHDPYLKDIFKDSQSRVKSIALVHEKLYQSPDLGRIDCREYITSLLKSIERTFYVNTHKVEISTYVPSGLLMDIDKIISCGLIINELVTNAIKHAFPGERRGCIRVELKRSENACVLVVSDNGVGLPEGFDVSSAKTLGLALIHSLAEQLGTLEMRGDRGTRVCITMPDASKV